MLPKTPSSFICAETLFLASVCFQVCEQAEYKKKKINLNKHFHTNGILLWTTRLWERGSVRNVNRVIFLDVKLFCLGRMLPRYVHMVQHEALVPKFISYHPAFPPSLSVCSLSSGSTTSRLNQSQHTFHAGLKIHLTES